MTLITTYVMRQLSVGTLVVCGSLLAVTWLTQSLRYVELMISQHVPIETFLTLTGLLLPSLLSVLLPFSAFIVTVFVYNKLSGDRETIVLQTAGLGPLQIARPALVFSIALSILGGILTTWLAPESMRLFKEKQWELRHSISHVLVQEGMFSTLAKGITLYVRNRSSQGEFLDIMIHDTRNPDKTHTILAERGSIAPGTSGITLILHNARSHRVIDGTGHMALFDSERLSFDVDVPNHAPGTRYREASERSMYDLLTDSPLNSPNGASFKDGPRFWAEALRRLFTPLSLIAFTIIATAGLLTGRFERRGQKKRIVWTIIIAVITQASLIGSVHAASHSFSLLGLIPLSVLIPAILAIVWLAKPTFGPYCLAFLSRP